MLKSISEFFDHNANKIREIAKNFKYAVIISALIAFYNLFSLGGDSLGTAIFLLVISSMAFWISLICRYVLLMVAKIADKISKAALATDVFCDEIRDVILDAFRDSKVELISEVQKFDLAHIPYLHPFEVLKNSEVEVLEQ